MKINWQIIPYGTRKPEGEEIINFKYLRLIGASLHRNEVIACWEFRMSYFIFTIKTKKWQIAKRVQFPIPFIKNDIGIMLFKEEK